MAIKAAYTGAGASAACRRPSVKPILAARTCGRVLQTVSIKAHDASHDAELQRIAQTEFGVNYTELDTEQRLHCAGLKGASHRWAGHEHHGAEEDPELQKIAEAEFGMAYEDLDASERQHCAGLKGASHRWAGHEHHGAEEDPELQKIAEAEFGMAYEDLDANQRLHCAGLKGASHRWADHERSVPRSYFDLELQAIAKAEFGKPYEELNTHEKRHCAGVKGMAHVKGEPIQTEGLSQGHGHERVHEMVGPEHHNVAPLAGPDAEELVQEHPDLVSYEQRRRVGMDGTTEGGLGAAAAPVIDGGVSKEELEAIAEEEYASHWDDLSTGQQERVGRLAGGRVTEELGPESGPMSAA